MVQSVTDTDFEAEVLQADGPVLVDFWADWCAPCRALAPVIASVAERHAGRLKVVKVDVDAAPMAASRYRVQSIPTLGLFVGGNLLQALQGAVPEAVIDDFLEKHIPDLTAASVTDTALAEALAQPDVAQRPVVFDLRAAFDFSRGHIRGAVHAETDALEAALSAHPDRRIVLVCRTGEASRAAASGFSDRTPPVAYLIDGVLGWEGSGRPTYSTQEEEELRDE